MPDNGQAAGPGVPNLQARDQAGAAARAILDFQLENLSRRLKDAGGGDVEPVHQLRVATRRLRAVLRMLAGIFPDQAARAAVRELSWLGRASGRLRDLDVLKEFLAERARKLDPGLREDLRALENALAQRRAAEYTKLGRTLESERLRRLLKHLEALEPDPQLADVALGAVAAQLARAPVRAAARAAARLDGNSAPEDLHRLRVRVKRLRYTFETLRPVGGKKLRKTLGRLEQAQATLGRYNDAICAIAWISDYVESVRLSPRATLAAGALLQSCAARSRKLRRDALKVCRRLRLDNFGRDALEELAEVKPEPAAAAPLEASSQ